MRSMGWLVTAVCLSGCAADRLAMSSPSIQKGTEDSADYADLTGESSGQCELTPQSVHASKWPLLYKVLGWDDGSRPKTEKEIEYDYKFRNNG